MINPLSPDFEDTPISVKRPNMGYEPVDNGQKPIVSIITPFFNTGAEFHETARSVLQQSFQQWEWIIVNDGSTNTEALDVLTGYRNLDARIRVIDLPQNRGVSAAKNAAVRCACSDYIVLLDSDDLLETTAVEKWFWFLQSYPEWSMVQGYSVGFGARTYLWTKGFRNGDTLLTENIIDYSCMIRKEVFQKTGGFDETIREGLEDWDFWCHVADEQLWGTTIPEYLKWYRTRENHGERWSNWTQDKLSRFREGLVERYPVLWQGAFPEIQVTPNHVLDDVPETIPCCNILKKTKKNILFILPWMVTGGADKFNIAVVKYLVERGWQVSIATTMDSLNEWQSEFGRYTSDIFAMPNFLRLRDYPRFINYLIRSRGVDVVCVSNSEIGYLLTPYIRHHFPDITLVDYNHAEAEDWKNGGYPRYTLLYQHVFDMNIVASEHLKRWMVDRGGDPDKINVCYVNVDTDHFIPAAQEKDPLRKELGLPDGIPIILYVARICAEKQPHVFLKTILKLRELNQTFHVIVAGDGPDFPWLKAEISKAGLDQQITLLGAVPNEHVQKLMQGSEILFLPSLREGISLTIYEAMATGMCVVGADVGGQNELLTPECGFLVRRSDEEGEANEYSRILAKLLTDPRLLSHMGASGRERVCQFFRLEKMGPRISDIIENVQRNSDRHQSVDFYTSRTSSALAVEYIRLSQVSDNLWEYNQKILSQPVVKENLVDLRSLRIRQLAFLLVRKLVYPQYLHLKKSNIINFEKIISKFRTI